MHYYQFNIGDYASHTKGLSLMEDLAFRRLLDEYYLVERPFNGCSTDIARRIGMRDQIDAVEYVLASFFTLNDAGEWVNDRADAEIAAYRDKAEKASNAGKASAKARKSNGGSTDVQLTLDERSTTVQPNIKQEPLTINQLKETTTTGGAEIFDDDFLAPENQDCQKIQDDWEPGQEAINAIRMQNVPVEFITESLPNFRIYQAEQQPLNNYNAKFVSSVLGSWKRIGHKWKPKEELQAGSGKPQPQRKASVFDLSGQNYASGDL